ncbi:MAG: Bug family tripartite tricarboxylate transporter substrate binding protein [Burkholderiaceae bacterium]
MRRRWIKYVLAGLLAVHAGLSAGQPYPARPVKLIVPFPPGSATDVIARLVATELQRELGQPFVVDNRAGGQGTIAAEALVRSEPDGYTLMVATSALASTPSMLKSVPFDTNRDFTPISRLVYTALAVMVRKDFPAQTPQEFIQEAKKRAAKLTGGYGSPAGQIALSQLRTLGGFDLVLVPYKGIPTSITDVIGGTLDMTISDLTNAMSQSRAGAVKIIGVTSSKRSPLVPDWPAMAESLPGYNVDAWIALMGPRGLNADIAERLHAAATRAIAAEAVQTRLRGFGMTAAPMGPAEMRGFFANEVQTYARLVKEAGIQPE